jgi:hypothetical protein
MLLVRSVLSKALEWQPRLRNAFQYCPRHGIKLSDEVQQEDFQPSSGSEELFTPPTVSCACPDFRFNSFKDQEIGFYVDKAITELYSTFSIGRRTLRDAVYTYLESQQIMLPNHRTRIVKIHSPRQVTLFHVIECLDYIEWRKKENITTSYVDICKRLASEERMDGTTLEDCPPIEIASNVLRNTLTKMGHTTYCNNMLRVGNIGTNDPVKAEATKWRRRVWILQYFLAMQEEEGLAVVMSLDESYVHKNHHSKQSVTGTTERDAPENEIAGSKDKGERLCMIGAITRWGHMIGYHQDEDGEILLDQDNHSLPIIDCAWFDNKGNKVQKGGHFKELNSKGVPRPDPTEPKKNGAI